MRKFVTALSLVSATALVSPLAFAKTKSVHASKAPAATAVAKTKVKSVKASVKREMPARGPHGRFLPRKKA